MDTHTYTQLTPSPHTHISSHTPATHPSPPPPTNSLLDSPQVLTLQPPQSHRLTCIQLPGLLPPPFLAELPDTCVHVHMHMVSPASDSPRTAPSSKQLLEGWNSITCHLHSPSSGGTLFCQNTQHSREQKPVSLSQPILQGAMYYQCNPHGAGDLRGLPLQYAVCGVCDPGPHICVTCTLWQFLSCTALNYRTASLRYQKKKVSQKFTAPHRTPLHNYQITNNWYSNQTKMKK